MADDPIPITDERLKAALHRLRVEFAYCQFQEFPLFGSDGLRRMNIVGLCSQAEANAAMTAARAKIIAEEGNPEFIAPLEDDSIPEHPFEERGK